ncbi:polysaccharide pyruvyl transferase family protein [Coleofasciculus sp. H7-2]|uniref:polysaccharide pyruvyl transferase family protein n=1 Tax=Coleofasciculus sp. H7-2 TaxID=3351545 RepID=UPI0036723D25
MKVGILTFHHTTNYGATLQAYALWTIIKDQGHDVEFIDYRPHRAVRYYLKEIQPINKKNKKFLVNRQAFSNLVKAWKMRRFLLSEVRLSRKKSYLRSGLKEFYGKYDLVVCGSDQIWCIDTYFRGFDPSYFLDFLSEQKTCRKVSYAASFGKTETLGKHQKVICKLISQFDAVAVRDSNSLRLIQEECGREAVKVLDPTFLVDYSKITSVPDLTDEYLLIYNQTPLNLEQQNFVRAVAKVKNLVIISVGEYDQVAAKNFINISPDEWLGYFSKASYVVTNTYHGTIFSLIFKKSFTVFANKKKSNKTNDLLQLLGLENRVILEPSPVSSITEESLKINYTLIDEKLEKEVFRSKTYLLNALDGKQG